MKNRIMLFGLLGMLVILSGCGTINTYLDVKNSGVVDMKIVANSDYSMFLDTIESASNDEGVFSVKRTDNSVVIEGALDRAKYNFTSKGFFMKRYTFVSSGLSSELDESDSDLYGMTPSLSQYINMPGKVIDYGSCRENRVDNGYEVVCDASVEDIAIVSGCFMFC